MTSRIPSLLAASSVLLLATCDLDKITTPPTDNPAVPVNFTISGGTEVFLGGTLLLNVTSPTDISSTVQRWQSANPATASVDSLTGLVTGNAIGVTSIRARLLSPELDTGVVQSQTVTVRYKGLRIAAVDSIEGLGLTRAITARGLDATDTPAGSPLAGVTWTSRDTSIFEVVGQTVVAKKAGAHRLVGEFADMKDSIVVRVRPVAKRIVFPDTHYVADAINANRTVPIRVDDVNDAVIVAPNVAWSVADPTVATINPTTGVLRFLKKDTTRVFATVDSVTRSLKVRVVQLPASITRTAGDAQTATVGSTLPTALVATVLDAGGIPVAGESITFRIGVGDDAVITDSVRITDANGQATLGSWTLGTTAGTQTVIATAGTATTTYTATAEPDAPTQLGFQQPPSSVQIGAVMAPVTVTVQDVHGNTVTDADVQVTLALVNNPGGATLGGTLTIQSEDGVAVFEDLTLDAGGTGYTIAASAVGLTGTTSPVFNVFGAPVQLAFLAQPVSTTAGVVMPTVQVAVQDVNGNVVASSVASIGLTIAANPGGSTLSGTTTRAAVNGVASFPGLSLNNAGVGYQLQASGLSGPGLTPAVSNTFTVAPVGAASKLLFSVEPSNVVAGQSIAPSIKVQVVDANGARVMSGTHNVTLAIATNPGSAAIGGTTSRSTVSGEATFDNISLSKVGTGYRLSATVTGSSITPATSTTFNVTAGGATQMSFLNQPTHTVAGQTMSPVRVALLDVNGNLVSSAPTTAITLNLVGSGCSAASLSGRGPINTVSGVATFDQLTSATQMTNCFLQAVATSFSNVQSTTFSIVAASAPVRLSFTAEPATSTTAGVGMNAGTVAFVNAAGTAASPASLTNINISVLPGSAGSISGGTTNLQTTTSATFNPLTFNTAGTYRLVATATGYRPDTSALFTVTPGAVHNVGFLQAPTNSAAGVPLAPVVQVAIRDQFGNTVTSATNTVRLNGNFNDFAANFRLNNGTSFVDVAAVEGVATFTGLAVYSAGTAHRFFAQVPGTSIFSSTTVFIDVERAPLTTLGFRTQPSPSVQAGQPINNIQVQAQDSVGNVYSDFTSQITLGLIPDDDATLSGTLIATPTSGVATFNGLSVDKTGTYRLGASGGLLANGASDEFTVTPATAVTLAFTRQPTNTFLNAPLSPADTVIVQVHDAFGNRVTSAGHFITFALGNNPGGANLSGTLGVSAVSGEARLGSDVTLDAVGSGYTITAATGGLTGATSDAFDVAPHGPATTLAWVVQPTNTALGGTVGPSPQVAVRDDYGNTVTTGVDASLEIFVFTSDGWGMGGTTNVTASSGIATFNALSPTSVGTGIGLTTFSATTVEHPTPLEGPNSDPFDVTGNETLLASTNSDVWDLTLSGTTLLWSETGRIQSMPAAGGPVTQLAVAATSPLGIVTDGTDVYWIETDALRKVPIGGGAITTLVTGIVEPHPHLEVDGSSVYFGAGTTLRSVSKSAVNVNVSTTTTLYSINARVGNTHGFELDDVAGTLFFSSGKGLWAGPAAGGSPTQLVPDSMVTIVKSGSALYYVTNDGLLRWVGTGGGAPTEIHSIGASGRLASDGVHVYWADDPNGVWKIPVLGGGTIQRLSVDQIWGIAMDATTIFWGRFVSSTNGTQIYSSPK